jgi:pyridoxine/pyridoxamine 5'-phosphate oxidase
MPRVTLRSPLPGRVGRATLCRPRQALKETIMSDRDGIFAGEDPFEIARAWLKEAEASEPNDPNAIALSTVDADGLPNARMVLLK